MSSETLLVELGTEELPPKALKSLGESFRDGIVRGLEQRALGHSKVEWFASPRRLAVLIDQVQLRAADQEKEALGPPADRAKDSEGNWTPAAIGFARKQGVEPEDLQSIDTPKGVRLGIRSTERGILAKDCLVDIINESIAELPIPKRMRWAASRTEFVRPVQWAVVMLGTESNFGDVLDVPSGTTTLGHRFHSAGPIAIARAEEYAEILRTEHVIASFDERQQIIRSQVEELAASLGAVAVIDEDLLDEVTGLVEWPIALAGSFEERFLEVPTEALVLSMKEHQKYFHLVDDEGQLKPNFITISNIESKDPQQVISGNERVIRPRLSDATFFFDTDKQTRLEDRVEKLRSIVFQKQLGTLYEKTQRVKGLTGLIAEKIGAPQEKAERAALLSKTDLLSDMVLEFADMQGIAGYYYALHDGEGEEVATALAQQYWPKFSGDQLPESRTACALALADRLDTLCGIFGIGQPPTGSKDPFALRRASLAVLRIIVGKRLSLDLKDCLELAQAQYPDGVIAPGSIEQVFEYVIERFRAWYEDEDVPVEVFRAVSAKGLSEPLDIERRVHAVNAFTQLPEATALAAANKRVANILAKLDKDHIFGDVSANLLVEPQEIALWGALVDVDKNSASLLEEQAYTDALASLAVLRDPLDAFFDDVLVNAEDEALRNNRLNLLKSMRELFTQVADISQLAVGK
ncbi:MAG: glycine--tRNA ligase subunit beta [Halioglobus sp.]